MTAITYNMQLNIFSFTNVLFSFQNAGTISITSDTKSMRTDLYSTSTDYIRAVLEFIFFILLIMSVREEYRDIKAARKRDEFWQHLFSAASVVDFLNYSLSWAEIFYWLGLVFGRLQYFEIPTTFRAYSSIESPARYFLENGELSWASVAHSVNRQGKEESRQG